MTDSEQSPSAPTWHRLRAEPFRLFFPLGVLLGWVGVGHWLLYATGITHSYSCFRHGLLQAQAFLMAFAVGFLWTALPRRTNTAPASTLAISLAAAALIATTASLVIDRLVIAELSYLALFFLVLQFAIRRFLDGSGRRPPAAFVLLPLGAALGVVGAAMILARLVAEADAWTMNLGALLIEQGLFLCFVMGVGALVLPLMAGAPPPADLGVSARETWRALGFLALGLVVAASLVAEQLGAARAGPIVRGSVVAVGSVGAAARGARPASRACTAGSSGSPPGSPRPASSRRASFPTTAYRRCTCSSSAASRSWHSASRLTCA